MCAVDNALAGSGEAREVGRWGLAFVSELVREPPFLCGQMMKDTPNSRAIEFHFADGPDKPPTSLSVFKPQMKDIYYTGWDSEVWN
jgi:hypothetical protein